MSIDWNDTSEGQVAYDKYCNVEPLKGLLEIQPKMEILPENEPIRPDAVRVVVISDTHLNSIPNLKLPAGDILIHCGDLTLEGTEEEFNQVNNELGQISHLFKHILVISGNHDIALGQGGDEDTEKRRAYGKKILTNAHYLLDESMTVFGIKFFGSPWVTSWIPRPSPDRHVFLRNRGEDINRGWSTIPEDTDVLITHCPPLGIMDVLRGISHEGDLALLGHVLNRVQPSYHLFGHMHVGHGVIKSNVTTFVNAATCWSGNVVRFRPILFDFPLRKGFAKT